MPISKRPRRRHSLYSIRGKKPSVPKPKREKVEEVISEEEDEEVELEEEEEEEEKEWAVEKILDCRKIQNGSRRKYEYLVKWVGYSEEESTWEPTSNLRSCADLLKTFNVKEKQKQRRLSEEKRKRKLNDLENDLENNNQLSDLPDKTMNTSNDGGDDDNDGDYNDDDGDEIVVIKQNQKKRKVEYPKRGRPTRAVASRSSLPPTKPTRSSPRTISRELVRNNNMEYLKQLHSVATNTKFLDSCSLGLLICAQEYVNKLLNKITHLLVKNKKKGLSEEDFISGGDDDDDAEEEANNNNNDIQDNRDDTNATSGDQSIGDSEMEGNDILENQTELDNNTNTEDNCPPMPSLDDTLPEEEI